MTNDMPGNWMNQADSNCIEDLSTYSYLSVDLLIEILLKYQFPFFRRIRAEDLSARVVRLQNPNLMLVRFEDSRFNSLAPTCKVANKEDRHFNTSHARIYNECRYPYIQQLLGLGGQAAAGLVTYGTTRHLHLCKGSFALRSFTPWKDDE